MTGKKFSILLVLFLALFIIYQTKNNNFIYEKYNLKGVHQVQFFEEKLFNQGVNKAADLNQPKYHISGGVVPHDLFASFIIADFFKRLSFQKPKTIILLGPNHFEKGNFKALTSSYNWNTPFGDITPDNSIINTLIDRKLVKADEEVLPNDHAVSGIIPFIRYYLPEAKVVPILLSGTMTRSESETLANGLSSLITKDVVVIASVDFSHYLPNKQAQEKDKLTLQTIKDFNLKLLFSFNNDYLDSPPSIGTLLMIMQKLGTIKMDEFYHTNSGQLQNNEFLQTTSYFSLAYY